MTKLLRTDITLVIDKSGSMYQRVSDVVGGYRQMIEEQQAVGGKCRVTGILFDTNYQVLFSGKKIAEVNPCLKYQPNGSTALLDAVSRAIVETEQRIEETPKKKRPKKVMIVINTDGEENSSREVDLPTLRQRVEDKQKEGWDFLFLGAGLEAFHGAVQLGVSKTTAVDVGLAPQSSIYAGLSRGLTSYRSGASGQSVAHAVETTVGADDDSIKGSSTA